MPLDMRIRELIAVGTAIGANCHPCLQHHVGKARDLGIPEDEIAEAIEAGRTVRKGAQGSMDKLANELVREGRAAPRPPAGGCGCGSPGVDPPASATGGSRPAAGP